MMFTLKTKHGIAYFLLALFVLIKASGLHVYTHSDHITGSDDCALCQFSNRDTLTPVLLLGTSVDFSEFIEIYFSESVNFYQNPIAKKVSFSEIFNNSPPIYSL